MSDNVTLNAGTGGATLATDDVGGVQYQVVKLDVGGDGVAAPVSNSNPVPVSDAGGSITVDGTVAATQSGAWNVTNVSGTVSLPTGAATAAKQPALGTAGTASTDVLTIQGIAGMTKLLVTPDSVALPANQSVNVSQINGVTPLMGTGVSGTGSHRVTIATDGQGQLVDNAGFTDGTTRVDVAGFIFDEVAGTALTENDVAAARIDSKRALVNVIEDATTRGQRMAVTSAGAASTNAAQVAGTTTATGNGTASAGCQRVTIASDNTAFSVNAVTTPGTSGGLSKATGTIGATKTAIKASAGQVYGWYFYNSNASVAYVQFFDAASASVTLGTTAPDYSLGIPAGSAANVEMSNGIAHATAITIAITTTRSGSTGPGSTVDYNVFYK